MKAVIALPDQGSSLADVDLAPPGPGQVRVTMVAVGVCRSDLSIADGTIAHRLPTVLGHEGAGIVAEIGAGVESAAVGDRVVLNWMPACGECRWCKADQPFLCPTAAGAGQADYAKAGDGTILGAALGTGAFAEEVVLGERSVVKLPDDIPMDQAALLGCMMLTGYGAVTHAAHVQKGETVLVLGAGGVGQAVIAAARLAGAGQIIAFDSDASKEEACLQQGATLFVGNKAAAVGKTAAATERAGADHVFDCVGSVETIRLGWRLTRRGGVMTVVGIGPAAAMVQFSAQELSAGGKVLRGCVHGDSVPARDIPVLADLVRSGGLDLAALIGDRIGLADLPGLVNGGSTGRSGRTVVMMGEQA